MHLAALAKRKVKGLNLCIGESIQLKIRLEKKAVRILERFDGSNCRL